MEKGGGISLQTPDSRSLISPSSPPLPPIQERQNKLSPAPLRSLAPSASPMHTDCPQSKKREASFPSKSDQLSTPLLFRTFAPVSMVVNKRAKVNWIFSFLFLLGSKKVGEGKIFFTVFCGIVRRRRRHSFSFALSPNEQSKRRGGSCLTTRHSTNVLRHH